MIGLVLSPPMRRLLEGIPADGRWVNVPPATRAVTVLALKKKGLIEHRYKQPRHWRDWVTWGEVRRVVKSDSPAPANLEIAGSVADWCASQCALPVAKGEPYNASPTPWAVEVMDKLFEARTTPGVLVFGGPRMGKTLVKRVGPAQTKGGA